MKIAHISDCHIRLLKYHQTYRIIFQELYEKLKSLNLDNIVFCGDLLHNKNTLSPEAVELATEFLDNLSSIASLYTILGNHDLMIRNLQRQDSVSPLVSALNKKNIYFLKNSQQIDIGEDIVLNVASICDKNNWELPRDKEKINILLYHGPIVGCVSDSGWKVEKGDMNLEYLSNFDYAFLGDIHKTNQIVDDKGKARYPGSCIQQNFSEDIEKGFLLWDIKSKEDFKCDFIPISNPNLFITIELEEDGKIPRDISVPCNSRVRLVSNNNLSFDLIKKTIDIVKTQYKAESVLYLNRSMVAGSLTEEETFILPQENLRDIEVQERLIKNYFKDFEIEEEVLEKVLELNRKYKTLIEQDDEEVTRNVNWKVKELEWDNLFNYGEKNKIDFTQLSGIVGIFGKSFSGKSSIVETLLYTLFNSISKNARKNYNIINQNKQIGSGRLIVEANGKDYLIKRESEKYDKKLKGSITEEAKTTVDFCVYHKDCIESLNGVERSDTDKTIRKLFGTIDDFLLTSMSSQFGALSFINEGSTKRKEILAKFLDLDMFEKKFKSAKEDAANIKGALKRIEEKDYDKEISKAEKDVTDNKKFLQETKKNVINLKVIIEQNSRELSELEKKIISVPTKIIDIKQLLKEIEQKEITIYENEKIKKQLEKELQNKEETLKKIDEFLNSVFDINLYKERFKEIQEKEKKKNLLLSKKENIEKEQCWLEKKTDLLKEVPCGSDFSNCKFIKDAYEAIETISVKKKEKENVNNQLQIMISEIKVLDPSKCQEYVEKYDKLIGKKQIIIEEKSKTNSNIYKYESFASKNKQELEVLYKLQQEYEQNKDAIENLESILSQKKQKEKELEQNEEKRAIYEDDIYKLERKQGSLEQLCDGIKTKKTELENLRREFSAFDFYQSAMHSDGIAYEIIKQKLPIINAEIAKILSNVVNFSVFFESEGNKLNINIKHESFDARPLEMGSGAEKVIASLAVRLALIKVSNLPVANFLVLDEPSVNLDESILESFGKMLDILKENFQFVLLITHLDNMKDLCDNEIIIEHKDKYAYVNQ
jgi:DNA repair exonuclease SbcCD ATPase subunit/DNA repair exonuclease SbcCD nuclease subunit